MEEWDEIPPEEVAAKYPVAYDCFDPETRRRINLRRYPMENDFDVRLKAYDEEGFRIIRERIVSHRKTGSLLNLTQAHTLFQTEPDDFGHVRNDVKYTVYPLGFTRDLGNVQADGVITAFARRMNVVDAKLRQIPRRRQRLLDGADDEEDDDDDEVRQEGDDVPHVIDLDGPIRAVPPPLLHAVGSQIYNAISHRVRDAAKFHEVQLGLITSSLSGTTATSVPSKRRWQKTLDRCRGDLPHVRFSQKVAGPGQPQCMRFENTYRLDVQSLPARKRSGE